MVIRVLIEPIRENTIVTTVNKLNKLNIQIPGMVFRAALHLRALVEAALLKTVRDILIKKRIPAEVESVTLLTEGDAIIGADISLRSIDYVKTAQVLLPDIRKMLDEREDGSLPKEIWSVIEDRDCEIISGALSALQEEQITRIIQMVLPEYREKICGAINGKLSQKQIPVRVAQIEIQDGR